MNVKNLEYPFDYYLNYLLKKKVSKEQFKKFSKEVFKIINLLKKEKPKKIRSKILGNIIIPKEDNGKKKKFL
tara:strand:- start:57 stop:272 length:216 start_codon:yes stop_codon:yes gene_type:complete